MLVKIALLIIWGASLMAAPVVVRVDFGQTNGLIRPLHGINKGPLGAGGLIDLTEQHKRLRVPVARLHDCHWPNPDVVDIHAVFPRPDADPQQPKSYDFRLTDEYIEAIVKSGAKTVYRLGESIEHTAQKRFVHPPKSVEQWAQICAGIIRHYNEGWGDGFRYGIEYWEIWNEPENRPAMWTGSDEEFLRLYEAAATRIKQEFPGLKVGGPGFGHLGEFKNSQLEPSGFVRKFLDLCRRERTTLDFFSWHCYAAQPEELTARSRAVRRMLDEYGLQRTESHLNEWNYLPGNSWSGLSRKSSPEERQKFYDDMAGPCGAVFVAAALMQLQEAPVDMCNLFHGELGGFGLFNENGVPHKTFYALAAFARMMDTPARVRADTQAGVTAIAGVSTGNVAQILLSVPENGAAHLRVTVANLPWPAPSTYQMYVVDAGHSLELTRDGRLGPENAIEFTLTQPFVILIRLVKS